MNTANIKARIAGIETSAIKGIRRAYSDNPRAYSDSGWQMLINATYCEYIIDRDREYYLLHLGYATFSVLDFVKYNLHIDGFDDVEVEVA